MTACNVVIGGTRVKVGSDKIIAVSSDEGVVVIVALGVTEGNAAMVGSAASSFICGAQAIVTNKKADVMIRLLFIAPSKVVIESIVTLSETSFHKGSEFHLFIGSRSGNRGDINNIKDRFNSALL